MAEMRTQLQRDTNDIDCDLYRIIVRVERIYDALKRTEEGSRVTDLHRALQSLRHARPGIRQFMDEVDRARTT